MNILFFITPKADTAYLHTKGTLRQAVDTMEARCYTAIPLLDDEGKYVGTVTEGDLLRAIMRGLEQDDPGLWEVPVHKVHRRREVQPVNADCEIEDLISLSLNQNFVPVVDDDGVFIGIIPRRAIIEHCYENSSLSKKTDKKPV